MNQSIAASISEQQAALPPSFEAFEAQALAQGCDEALARVWQPDTLLPEHSHPFDAEAVVVQGEMWLNVAGRDWHLLPGSTFKLPAGTPHAERYGPQGATFWVGRRHAAR